MCGEYAQSTLYTCMQMTFCKPVEEEARGVEEMWKFSGKDEPVNKNINKR